jgi:hypothetical protein
MTPERWRRIEELYQAARDPVKRTALQLTGRDSSTKATWLPTPDSNHD